MLPRISEKWNSGHDSTKVAEVCKAVKFEKQVFSGSIFENLKIPCPNHLENKKLYPKRHFEFFNPVKDLFQLSPIVVEKWKKGLFSRFSLKFNKFKVI